MRKKIFILIFSLKLQANNLKSKEIIKFNVKPLQKLFTYQISFFPTKRDSTRDQNVKISWEWKKSTHLQDYKKINNVRKSIYFKLKACESIFFKQCKKKFSWISEALASQWSINTKTTNDKSSSHSMSTHTEWVKSS